KQANEEAEELSKMTIRITNHHLDGKTVGQCVKLIGRKYVISRMMDNGNLIVPAADTVIHYDDVILVVTAKADEEAVLAFLGEIDDSVVWKEDDSTMVSRRIVITRDEINGKRIRNLRLRNVYGVNITRVSRSGVDLVASPDLTLQVGDKVMVVGPLEAVKKAEKMLGDTLKRLRYPHLVSLFLGILAGIIVGSIPIYIPNMPMPAKLGLAGGPLIVSILVGRFGYKAKLISYTTQSANLMLREMGISLFLASVGIGAGGNFVDTIVSGDGLLWVGLGFIITFVPAIIIGVVARKFLKMNYGTLMGLMAGSTTNPSALAYSTQTAGNDAPAVAYSTVYPLTMFLRIIIAQMLILIMMS
ncbi:MAG: transporter, partial [Paludibacteraceae bacterium]|nr:transporter [Paludibacteraceae bacterium]